MSDLIAPIQLSRERERERERERWRQTDILAKYFPFLSTFFPPLSLIGLYMCECVCARTTIVGGHQFPHSLSRTVESDILTSDISLSRTQSNKSGKERSRPKTTCHENVSPLSLGQLTNGVKRRRSTTDAFRTDIDSNATQIMDGRGNEKRVSPSPRPAPQSVQTLGMKGKRLCSRVAKGIQLPSLSHLQLQ